MPTLLRQTAVKWMLLLSPFYRQQPEARAQDHCVGRGEWQSWRSKPGTLAPYLAGLLSTRDLSLRVRERAGFKETCIRMGATRQGEEDVCSAQTTARAAETARQVVSRAPEGALWSPTRDSSV